MTELQALQNHAQSLKIEGLLVSEWQEQDKRKTSKKYIVSINSQSISPVLDYENMNVFLLGIGKAEKIKAKKDTYSIVFTFGATKWSVIITGELMPSEAIQKAIEQMNEQKRYFTSVECIDIL